MLTTWTAQAGVVAPIRLRRVVEATREVLVRARQAIGEATDLFLLREELLGHPAQKTSDYTNWAGQLRKEFAESQAKNGVPKPSGNGAR